jgi:hypothetical protein
VSSNTTFIFILDKLDILLLNSDRASASASAAASADGQQEMRCKFE